MGVVGRRRNELIEFTRLQTGCFQVEAVGKSRKIVHVITGVGR